jgi:hypothetical protein
MKETLLWQLKDLRQLLARFCLFFSPPLVSLTPNNLMAGAEIPQIAPKIYCENDPRACQDARLEDRDWVMNVDFKTSVPWCQLECCIYASLVMVHPSPVRASR